MTRYILTQKKPLYLTFLLEAIVRFHKEHSRPISFCFKNDSKGLFVAIPQTKSHNYKRFCELNKQTEWIENILRHVGGANRNENVTSIDEGRLFMARYLANKCETCFFLAAKENGCPIMTQMDKNTGR